jgi:hypothetical protein
LIILFDNKAFQDPNFIGQIGEELGLEITPDMLTDVLSNTRNTAKTDDKDKDDKNKDDKDKDKDDKNKDDKNDKGNV